MGNEQLKGAVRYIGRLLDFRPDIALQPADGVGLKSTPTACGILHNHRE